MAHSHHDLPAFLGFILVILVRSLYDRFSHRRQCLNLPNDDTKAPREGETESLLPRSTTAACMRPLSIREKCIIGIAATGYMAIAIYGKHADDTPE